MWLLTLSLSAWSCEPPRLLETTTAMREAIYAGAPDSLGTRISEDLTPLSCVDHWVSPEELAAYFQAAGTLAALSLDQPRAEGRWALAARLAGAVPFDLSLGQVHQPAYEKVRAAIQAGPQGKVAARTDVRLDGWILRFGESRSVPAGEHLIQYTSATGAITSELVLVSPEQQVLVGPEALPRPSTYLPPAPSKPPVPLVVSGGILVVGGGLALLLGGSQLQELGMAKGAGLTEEEQLPLVQHARAYTWGGVGALALGGSLLVGASLQAEGGGFALHLLPPLPPR